MYLCACAYTRVPYINICGVGFGVAVWIKRQYQSLDWRNSKIAVPLSFFIGGTSISEVSLFLYANRPLT